MSYDVYFWHSIAGHQDDAFDALAEDDLSPFLPHPSVRAFRQELLARNPELADVVDPLAEPGSDADMRYLALTLPYGSASSVPRVMALASAHGLVAWDPQRREHLPARHAEADQSANVASSGITGSWTVRRLSRRGIGTRSLTRAWSAAGLGDEATFGEAVGVYILAIAIHDGFPVSHGEARRAVTEVAAWCASGVPRENHMVGISNSITDVTGFARFLAGEDQTDSPYR